MAPDAVRPQLAYLTTAFDELRAKGTHFSLRILDGRQAPVCCYDGREVNNLASGYTRPAASLTALETLERVAKRMGVLK